MVRSRTPDATPALLHGLPSDLPHGIHGRELCYRHFLGGLIEGYRLKAENANYLRPRLLTKRRVAKERLRQSPFPCSGRGRRRS